MNKIDSNELTLLAEYLISDNIKFNIGDDNSLTYNISRLTETGQGLAIRALEAWTEVTGIKFRPEENYDSAEIRFHEDNTLVGSGHASLGLNGHSIIKADIGISAEYIRESEGQINPPILTTFLHEIGHALGLSHSSYYNPGENDPIDSKQATVMSYNGGYISPVTPQIADIIAVHDLYNIKQEFRTGDTVYGIGTNLDDNTDGHLKQVLDELSSNPILEQSRTTFIILDDGGIDTIDFSSDQTAQHVNLNPEWASKVYGARQGNMIIARETIIENYIGGSSLDLIIGNNADNILEGRNGDDTLEGGPGADTLDGGPGQDTVSYESSSAGVLVRLHDARAVRFGDAEGDTLIDFEHLTGSAHNDILAGDGGDNILEGGDGDDVLYGGPADSKDRPFGGNHDHLYGGNGDDRLFGGEGNDVLRGGPGHDSLRADGNAMDVLHGGPETDFFVFYPNDLGGGTIQDFTDGEDKIHLLAFTDIHSIEDLDITPLGDNVHIELKGEDYLTMIILSDFDVNNLDNSDFIFVA